MVAGQENESGLIAALRAGSEAAAEQLVREHVGWMRGLALRMLGDGDAADDCVQDALINALRHIDKFKGDAALKTWLHRIVVNTALMRLRKLKRLNEVAIDDLQPQYDAGDHRISEPVTPQRQLEADERQRLVMQAIAQLPESYRIVLQLRDIQELSTAEVAAELGITEANVKVRLHRGRAALKTLLALVLGREENQ